MKFHLLKKNLILYVCLTCFYFIANASNSSEDQVFDLNKKSPVEILKEHYNKSKILFIGSPGHLNYKVYFYLAELLKLVGKDPNLKTIVLERFGDKSSFYEALSNENLQDAISSSNFTATTLTNTLCGTPEWAYTIQIFMPIIRGLNKDRARGNKVFVKTIDGLTSEFQFGSQPNKTESRDCTFLKPQGLFEQSSNREDLTQNNFERLIRTKMNENEKMIVVYHFGHLISGFKSCNPVYENGDWFSQKGELNWRSRFIKRQPEVTEVSKFVVVDEAMFSFLNLPGFKLSERQSVRYPNQDFGVNLAPFASVLTNEKGTQIFTNYSWFTKYLEGSANSENTLPEMADALIWSSNSPQDFHLLSPSQYLPDYCK
jgi:hypothetical protein